MKTFNEKDLITWTNRHEAKIKTSGYCANSIKELKDNINADKIRLLVSVSNDYERCFNCRLLTDHNVLSYGFFLPKDAVKENKSYRACRTIEEFSDVVDLSSIDYADDSDYIYDLIDKTIHIRSKNTGTEYYTSIRSISVNENGYIKILMTGKSYLSFNNIFNNYEIEKNGEWQPFGVLEE